MNPFEQLKNLTSKLEGDFQKFYEGKNHAAGTRLRAGMQDIKKLAQEIRVEIMQKKKA